MLIVFYFENKHFQGQQKNNKKQQKTNKREKVGGLMGPWGKKSEKHYPALGDGTLSGVIVDCCTETGLAKKINSFVMGGVLQNTN